MSLCYNGHMANIYKAISKCGRVYVGVTTRPISFRIATHKWSSNYFERNEFQKLMKKHGVDYFKFKVVEECKNSEMFDRERAWILKYKNKGISLNNSLGGRGPNGIKMPEHQTKVSGRLMKQRWEKDRKGMLKKVNSHKTKEFQSSAGILGGHGKAAKQPWFKVYQRSNGKLIGRFQTKREFSKVIGISESTTGRYLSGKLKIGNELYRFVWERG